MFLLVSFFFFFLGRRLLVKASFEGPCPTTRPLAPALRIESSCDGQSLHEVIPLLKDLSKETSFKELGKRSTRRN